jgi:hypothetical protein
MGLGELKISMRVAKETITTHHVMRFEWKIEKAFSSERQANTAYIPSSSLSEVGQG